MLVNTNSDMQTSTYAVDAAAAKTTTVDIDLNKPAPAAPTDTVTLSPDGQRLADALNSLATPVDRTATKQAKKKNLFEQPIMLQVDAFRLIREKLRAINLGIKGPDAPTQKNKDAKAEDNKIQVDGNQG